MVRKECVQLLSISPSLRCDMLAQQTLDWCCHFVLVSLIFVYTENPFKRNISQINIVLHKSNKKNKMFDVVVASENRTDYLSPPSSPVHPWSTTSYARPLRRAGSSEWSWWTAGLVWRAGRPWGDWSREASAAPMFSSQPSPTSYLRWAHKLPCPPTAPGIIFESSYLSLKASNAENTLSLVGNLESYFSPIFSLLSLPSFIYPFLSPFSGI